MQDFNGIEDNKASLRAVFKRLAFDGFTLECGE